MKLTFWTPKGQAYVLVTGPVKEFKRSIRYELPDGSTITVRKDDVISLERMC